MPTTPQHGQLSLSNGLYLDSAARSLQGILCRRDAQHAYIVRVRKDRNDAAGEVAPIRRKGKLGSEDNDAHPILNWNAPSFSNGSDNYRSQQAS